jgi:hypothetical protein
MVSVSLRTIVSVRARIIITEGKVQGIYLEISSDFDLK